MEPTKPKKKTFKPTSASFTASEPTSLPPPISHHRSDEPAFIEDTFLNAALPSSTLRSPKLAFTIPWMKTSAISTPANAEIMDYAKIFSRLFGYHRKKLEVLQIKFDHLELLLQEMLPRIPKKLPTLVILPDSTSTALSRSVNSNYHETIEFRTWREVLVQNTFEVLKPACVLWVSPIFEPRLPHNKLILRMIETFVNSQLRAFNFSLVLLSSDTQWDQMMELQLELSAKLPGNYEIHQKNDEPSEETQRRLLGSFRNLSPTHELYGFRSSFEIYSAVLRFLSKQEYRRPGSKADNALVLFSQESLFRSPAAEFCQYYAKAEEKLCLRYQLYYLHPHMLDYELSELLTHMSSSATPKLIVVDGLKFGEIFLTHLNISTIIDVGAHYNHSTAAIEQNTYPHVRRTRITLDNILQKYYTLASSIFSPGTCHHQPRPTFNADNKQKLEYYESLRPMAGHLQEADLHRLDLLERFPVFSVGLAKFIQVASTVNLLPEAWTIVLCLLFEDRPPCNPPPTQMPKGEALHFLTTKDQEIVQLVHEMCGSQKGATASFDLIGKRSELQQLALTVFGDNICLYSGVPELGYIRVSDGKRVLLEQVDQSSLTTLLSTIFPTTLVYPSTRSETPEHVWITDYFAIDEPIVQQVLSKDQLAMCELRRTKYHAAILDFPHMDADLLSYMSSQSEFQTLRQKLDACIINHRKVYCWTKKPSDPTIPAIQTLIARESSKPLIEPLSASRIVPHCRGVNIELQPGALPKQVHLTANQQLLAIDPPPSNARARILLEWNEASHTGLYIVKFKFPPTYSLDYFELKHPEAIVRIDRKDTRGKADPRVWRLRRVPRDFDEEELRSKLEVYAPIISLYPVLRNHEHLHFLIEFAHGQELDFACGYEFSKPLLYSIIEQTVKDKLKEAFPNADEIVLRPRQPLIVEAANYRRTAEVFYGKYDEIIRDLANSRVIDGNKIRMNDEWVIKLTSEFTERFAIDRSQQELINLVITSSKHLQGFMRGKSCELEVSDSNESAELRCKDVKTFQVMRKNLRNLIEGQRIRLFERYVLPHIANPAMQLKQINTKLQGFANCFCSIDANGAFKVHCDTDDPFTNNPQIESILKKFAISEKQTMQCAICYEDKRFSCKLSLCGHSFCLNCTRELFVSTISHLPIRCPLGNCLREVSLFDIENVLTEKDLTQLRRAAVQRAIATNQGVFDYCPKADCPGIYKVADQEESKDSEEIITTKNQISCQICQTGICAHCRVATHTGFTCQQYARVRQADQEMNDFLNTNGVTMRRCPECKMLLEKRDGCNHIQCQICKFHICWFKGCMEKFKEERQCYDHMNQVHGTYYDQNDSEGGEVDIDIIDADSQADSFQAENEWFPGHFDMDEDEYAVAYYVDEF